MSSIRHRGDAGSSLKIGWKLLISDNRVWFGADGNNVPRQKVFLSEARDGLTPHTLWTAEEVGTTDSAKKNLTRLFGGVCVFDTPKPIELLQRIVQIAMEPDDVALDFFAGSAPLGEAVLKANETDAGNRRFILVQLPEPIDDSLPQAQEIRAVGLETIADIGRDRVRRVFETLESSDDSYANGFRVFKLDS